MKIGNNIKLNGFGSFNPYDRKSNIWKKTKNGNVKNVELVRYIKFVPSNNLKNKE